MGDIRPAMNPDRIPIQARGISYTYWVEKGGGPSVEFEGVEDVFFPTHTSELLIQTARESILKKGKILDLGCGIGVCGLALGKLGLCDFPVHLSDVSPRAVELTLRNARQLGVPAVVRQGSLFDPWEGESFDVIVDDVSGVAEEIASYTPWFPGGVDCRSGKDGTSLIVEVLRRSGRHLNPGGIFLFPVLSLSKEDKILEVARAHFDRVERVAEQSWFLPQGLLGHLEKLLQLRDSGMIRLEQKFGCWLWSTAIYKATSPRHGGFPVRKGF